MTPHTEDHRSERRADAGNASETANFASAWRRFRSELDARLVERFGLAFQESDGDEPDPAVLADLALQRALMP